MKICRVGIVALGIALMPSCNTPSKPAPPPPPQAQVRFEPAWHVSPIHLGEGKYPDLFGSGSRAIWIDDGVVEAKKAAATPPKLPPPGIDKDALAIAHAYIVIECDLESQFGDMSVAYDAVRLRGITAYLETPDGKRIEAIQSRGFGAVQEQPVDALKLFKRSSVVIFPKDNLFLGGPSVSASAPAVRLVLEGSGAKYYFEWPCEPQPAGGGVRMPTPEESKYVAQLGYYELFTEIRRLAHISE